MATRLSFTLLVPSARAAEGLRAAPRGHSDAPARVLTLDAFVRALFARLRPELKIASDAHVFAAMYAAGPDASRASDSDDGADREGVRAASLAAQRAHLAHALSCVREQDLLAAARVPLQLLDTARIRSVLAPEAKQLCAAMAAGGARLTRAGLVPASEAIAALLELPFHAVRACVAEHFGHVNTRGLLGLSESAVQLLTALEISIALPLFDRPLDLERDRDALEVLADDVSRRADAAPELREIAAPLGDLQGGLAPSSAPLVSIDAYANDLDLGQHVARRIADAHAAGTPLARIAVVDCGATQAQVRAVRDALRAAGVGVPHSGATLLQDARIVRAFAAAVATLTGPFRRERAAALLANPFLDCFQSAGVARRDARRVARGIANLPELRATDFAAGLARIATELPQALQAPALAFAKLCARLGHALLAAHDWPTSHAALSLTLNDLGFARSASQGAAADFQSDAPLSAHARSQVAALSEASRALRRFADALDELAAAAAALHLEAARIGPQVVLQAAQMLLAPELPLPPASRAGVVAIGSPRDLCLAEPAHVVVLGASRGSLAPRPQRSQVLAGRARELLEKERACPLFAPELETRLGYLALVVATAARIEVACAAALEDPDSALPRWLEIARTRALLGAAPAASLPPRPLPAAVALRVARETAREQFFLNPRAATPEQHVLAGMLAAPSVLALELGSAARPLAITALERFVGCRFRGYVERILAPAQPEVGDELLVPRSEGTLQHELLDVAFREAALLWPRRPRPQAEILERAAAAMQTRLASVTVRTLAEVDVATLQLRVLRIVEQAITDLDWDFYSGEQSFGSHNDAWPALELLPSSQSDSAPEPRIFLRGRIDRIDKSAAVPNAYRVIDYKRSAPSGSAKARALQLPLYALAVEAATQGEVTQGAYASLRAGLLLAKTPSGVAKDQESWAKLRDAAPATASAALTRLRAGDVRPMPQDSAYCTDCDAREVCRRPAVMLDAADDLEQTEEFAAAIGAAKAPLAPAAEAAVGAGAGVSAVEPGELSASPAPKRTRKAKGAS